MKKYCVGLVLLLNWLLLSSQNLIDNGGFEQDYDNWTRLTGSNGAMAFYSLETTVFNSGGQSLRINTKEVGTNAWDNQLIHKGFYPTKDEEYKLTFFAKTKEFETDLTVVLQNTSYNQQVFKISTEWKQYEWTFKAAEDFLQLKYFFTQKGTFYIDDIVLVAKNYKAVEIKTTDTTRIDLSIKHQKIEGFGSALAFYESWVTDHPAKEEMYQLVFQDLGLDWLRIRNDFKYQENFAVYSKEFVDKAKKWRGDSLRVLMCGWTPPATLKNNDKTNNGTLKKDANGFIYDAYSTYWKDALLAYQKAGIYPNWLSIQNEPDWLTDEWETCKFDPTESEKYPGYDKALASVLEKIKDIQVKPQLLGSEMLGIGNNNFYLYNSPLKSNENLYAYAYHLYNGGDPDHPDSYNAALQNIKKDFSNKPNVMTEYEHKVSTWYKTAWLMNNVLTEANASAYFYWDLIWPNGGLIDIDNPYQKDSWRNAKGYKKTGSYYAFKHFSRHIEAGDQRVEHKSSNSALENSAYLSADGKKLVIILINPTEKDIKTKLELGGMSFINSKIYQSVENNFYQDKGGLVNSSIELPTKSVTTLVLNIK
jgi:glucuronoarabinoxylan endo-1,4-beta-xylanase